MGDFLSAPPLSQQAQYVKLGQYGDVGTAKTTNLASLARLGKVVAVDSEAGLENGPLEDLGIPTDNIIPFRDITYDALDDLHWQIRAQLDSDPGSIVGVTLDSMTEIVAKLVEQTNDAEIERQIRKAQRRGEDTSSLSKFKVDLSSWGIVTEQVRRLIRRYRDLPCHVGWAALERRDVDQNDGSVHYGPRVNPGLQGDLVGYVGIVAHTWVDGTHPETDAELFVAHMRRTGKYVAKDRFHVTPKRMAVPSFDRIVKYVNGELTADNDPIQQAYREVVLARRDAAKQQPQAA